MEETEIGDFLTEIQTDDLDEAIFWALENTLYDHAGPRWFGVIGNGVFFADTNHARFLSDTKPMEAIGVLRMEYGDEAVEAFENCVLYGGEEKCCY